MITITFNGDKKEMAEGLTVAGFVESLGLEAGRVAVEKNTRVIRRKNWGEEHIQAGDCIEVVTFVGGGAPGKAETATRRQGDKVKGREKTDELVLGKYRFKSRLILGTGRYRTMQDMVAALEAADVDMVTVAVRRVDPGKSGSLLDYLDRERLTLLPNTAGCYTAEEAVRTARLGREAGFSDLIKLEVIGDQKTLLPDVVGLLKATEILAKEGFAVLPYTTDDPVMAKRLQDAGAAAVMPLAAPIGSGLGIRNPLQIQFVKEAVSLPVIVDAGVGVPSDVAAALELGVDGILMNTGIALARDPATMARAMRLAVEAGRLAYLAGRMPKKSFAEASSPVLGKIQE